MGINFSADWHTSSWIYFKFHEQWKKNRKEFHLLTLPNSQAIKICKSGVLWELKAVGACTFLLIILFLPGSSKEGIGYPFYLLEALLVSSTKEIFLRIKIMNKLKEE